MSTHWIAIALAAACGFLIAFGLGAAFEHQDTQDREDGILAVILLAIAALCGLCAIAVGSVAP